jgi:hypothetical protein
MKYILVYDNNMKGVEKKVNEHIKLGYEPLGGICVVNFMDPMGYYQVMVRV